MSYSELTKEISSNLRSLRKGNSEVMTGFSAMAGAAMKTSVLDEKTKELIAMAIGVSTRCKGCIGFHAQALVRLGATREELLDMLGVAVYMGGGPSLMYAAEAISAFEEFSAQGRS